MDNYNYRYENLLQEFLELIQKADDKKEEEKFNNLATEYFGE